MAETTTPMQAPTSGYVDGSDVLVNANGKDIGHGTGHTATYSTETKTRAVKPPKGSPFKTGKFKEKTVVGLDLKVSVKGLRYYGDAGANYAAMLDAWAKGEPVELKLFNRANETKPYIVGKFLVTNLTEDNNPDDDATWSADFEITGAPTVIDATNTLTGAIFTA